MAVMVADIINVRNTPEVYTEMVEMGNFIYVYFTTVKNKKKRE
jgi:hypothetical protein